MNIGVEKKGNKNYWYVYNQGKKYCTCPGIPNGFESRRKCERYEAKVSKIIKVDNHLPPGKITIGELVDKYLRDFANPALGNIKMSTYEETLSRLKNHLLPTLAHIKIYRLRKNDITQFINKLKRECAKTVPT